ncbi:MAG TPA: asparagine synthase (glutamine-hydrolyzing) [Tepidisphaeraceae bacterium]|nr:asparagine synthase (glutamine-hydrolyzing) [Tepidisphaeraceae bacterium]
MCGIAGIISQSRKAVEEDLARATRAQAHRGPDDSGEQILSFGRAFLGLGQRRLSIIDLSPLGHQPMVHPRTGDQIIFNGEIYNFQALRRKLESDGEVFKGHSDTEVLLHGLVRYGPEYVRRLEGMYAFAFFSVAKNELMLARDPMGIKPLYVSRSKDLFLFASEVRALLASNLVSKELDPRGIAGLLAYGAVQHPQTIFAQVKSFPPGHWQIVSADGVNEPVRFWDYPAIDNTMDEQRAVAALQTTLDAAVRDHLIADVPVGVFLSSGLDSTIIAGLAKRYSPNIRAFTVGFAEQPEMSEIDLASETARLFGLNHTIIQIDSADAEAAAFNWLGAMDQPSLDGLNVYVISKAVRAQGITVALSGQGGDELFGGYPSFSDVPRFHRFMRTVQWVPRSMRGGLGRLAAVGRSEAVGQKVLDIARSTGSVMELALQRRRSMSSQQLSDLGISSSALGLTSAFQLAGIEREIPIDGDVISAVSRIESCFYQGNMLLRDGDANGMAHGLEIRVPLLDQRLLNLVHTFPGHVRLPTGRADKHLLRVAFPSLLRPDLLNQKKRGFTLPIRRWMLGPLKPLCEQSLEKLKSVGMLRESGIDAIWQSFLNEPDSPIWSRAFTLCVLGRYLEQMGL